MSVMMAAYNTRDYIEDSVRSVLTQTFTNFELLIIDDGSTDGTSDILRRLAASDDRIRLTRRPNAGIVATRNELLEMAAGEFVAILDSDDLALPRRLELSVDYLGRYPEVLVVGGQVEVIDPDGDPLCVWQLKQSNHEIDAQLLSGEDVAICHSAATIRRDALRAIGGYRDLDRFRGQAEDFDLWLRLSERGPLINLPQPLVRYRLRLSSASISGAQQQAAAGRVALADARRRRGLPDVKESGGSVQVESETDLLLRWGWWALGAGHVTVARKHARRVLLTNPFAPKSWKLMLASLRGY